MRLVKLCLLLFWLSQNVQGQSASVTGKVTDAQTNEPIPGVSVVVKGTTRGTITDVEGKFMINASPDDFISFSSIGYLKTEILVGNQSNIQITLKQDIQELDAIVVVGYGTSQKKDITGSVAVVDSKEFESRANTQVSSLIQGKAAGVQVLASSGKPSAGLNIRIRGTNSINAGSEPLYVVDGVPTTDTRLINPADVESVSILKDASSAAIYGAQGANGVVLITTKKGRSDKPLFSFDTYRGFSQVWNTLPVLNGEQYRDLMTELGQNTDWTRYTANTDWQKEVFRNGTSQNYQLSLSGKSNNTAYYISGGWAQQQGAVRSSEMGRYSFKVNLDQKVNDWFSLGTNISYSDYADVDVSDNTNVNSGGVLLGVLSTPSVIGIYNPNGTFTSNPFQNWENPIASTDGSERGYKNRRLLGNLYAEIKFLKDFSFRSNLGIDYSNAKSDYFLDPFRTSYGIALKGIGRYNTWLNNYYIFDNTLSFKKDINKHHIELLAGSVIQKFHWESSAIERRNFASAQITTPNGGSEIITATASQSEKANAAFIGRVNYDFGSKYLLTVNFRADGSSVFGPQKRWGYFPSFSLGWRLSEESFLKDVKFVSDLKLRAGWGIVGNDQIGTYAYLGRVGSGSNYPIGGVVSPGTYPASIENQNLKWEQSEQTNIGIDFTVLNGRLQFTADAYVKNTKDLLLNAPLPRSTGFDNAIQNIGQLRNRGLEFLIHSVNIDKKLKWSTDFNISFNRNKVVNIVGQQLFVGNVAGRGDVALVREGFPLGTFYGYVSGGVDPETGNVYYVTQDETTTFSPSANDRQVIGDANPDFIYGITNTVSYKSFSLSIFLQGSQGNDIFNATRIETEGMTDPKNQSKEVLRRWRQTGDITDIPKAVWGNTNNSRISTRFVEDGSYIRVKALTLSYNLPQALLSKIKFQNARIYVTGENLLTFTKYSGFDPEVNAFGGSNTALGVDYGTYPQTKNITFGLHVSF